jgi:hypothetical protein
MGRWSLLFIFFYQPAIGGIISYDSAWFYTQYEHPTSIIDFSALKDGTTYADLSGNSLVSPLSTGTYKTTGQYLVYGEAWSEHLLLRGKTGGGFSNSTWWNGNSVSLYNANRFSILALSPISTIALDVRSPTYKGFIGIIATTPDDNFFIFGDKSMEILSLSYNFSPVKQTSPDISAVSEPPALFLLIFGLIFIAFNQHINTRIKLIYRR